MVPSWVSDVALGMAVVSGAVATLQVFFFTALASIVCGAVLTLGDALVLSSLGLHPWTS